MFETMLREMLLHLVREDAEFRSEIYGLCEEQYNRSVGVAVQYVILNDGIAKATIRQMIKQSLEEDGDIQDVIRKQATTDTGELIIDMIERDLSVNQALISKIELVLEDNPFIAETIDDKIKDLTFEVSVS
jgi:hypothetical protein